ncbi:ABC transporter substrate-binding protein [Leptolyngbyaceae cyanobacterium CCMR0082]|uniref:ABC transporter substrate-binding protein n=1 Tax=Adonisia turfae CCMR0082 TaxID=2304604 RepID=A0A6M0SGJ3_9CYAN|nr:ABC transporter substrate-binding protein [Adonisia turfae]NEZ67700.1 ABC transporter substrate-binding protein [Adonisia turfae CCMR0082]
MTLPLAKTLTRGALATLMLLAVGCSGATTTSENTASPDTAAADNQAPVTITLAYPYGDLFTDVHRETIEKFEAENPNIDIALQAPLANYEELAQRTLVGITQRQAPTISFQGINQVRQFVDAGHVSDLSEFVAADSRWTDGGLYENMMALGEFDGKQYAIPFAVSTPIMYYNVELLEQAGLDPENPPQTWPEVIEAAKKVQALGGDVTGMWYDYLITGNWAYQALVYSKGSSMMDDSESNITFGGETGVEAAQLLRSFVDEGVMQDWSREQGIESFVSGKVGFYFSSTSSLANLQEKSNFNLKTALFPTDEGGERRLPTGGNAAVIITDDPAEAKAAYEYAMFAAGPIGNNIMVNGTGYMPMHKEAVDEAFYEANPNYQASIDQIPYIFRWYSFPGENNLKIIDTIKESLQAVVSGKETPEAAITKAADQAQDLVK